MEDDSWGRESDLQTGDWGQRRNVNLHDAEKNKDNYRNGTVLKIINITSYIKMQDELKQTFSFVFKICYRFVSYQF